MTCKHDDMTIAELNKTYSDEVALACPCCLTDEIRLYRDALETLAARSPDEWSRRIADDSLSATTRQEEQ